MAVVATKIHAHGLTRTTTGLAGHYCDGCRASLVGESYRCGPCNFDLCGACFGKHKSTQATRVHAHPVTYTNTGLDRHYCDVCSAATTREAWRCASCNFDVCTTCFETLSAPKPAAVARPAGEVKAAAAAPLSVAQHAHPLVSTSGLSGHFCDGCKGAVTTSYRCAPCNWDLCAACYTKSNQRISRLHAHPITHTTTGLESHYCDGCRVPTETESWRCSDCNFDLCKECTTRSSAPKATETKAAAPAAAAAAAAAPAATELKCHPHALKRTTHGLKGHHCDGCRASPLSVSFRCDECNFDLCSACNESTHKQSLSLHPHAVQWTTVGLAGHFCNVCRVVMEGAHPQAWRCNGCDFDVCQACVTRVKAPKPTAAAAAAAATRPTTATATAATTEVKAPEAVMTKAHQHGLLRTTTGLSGHHCDGCRATGLAVAHRCNSCDFDLCESCFSRNRLAHTSRMHAHPLAFARGLREHWCDDCRAPCTSAWRCDDCNFDLCLGCFARAKLPKPAPVAPVAPAVAAAPATAAVARPAATEVKVERHGVKSHAHPVSLVSSGLTGHFCDSCNASPLTSAYRCHECNYDVCSGCFETARTHVSSRVHTHPMRWTAGLEAHYCDVCRKTAPDMYRCDSCNFDCCTTCLRAAQAPVAVAAVAAVAAPAPSAPAAPVAAPAPAPVAAAPAAAFWSCAACTYVNPALASTCYICSTSKA